MTKIETIYLEGNPLQKSDPSGYRRKVKLNMPESLKQIDATLCKWKLSTRATGTFVSLCVFNEQWLNKLYIAAVNLIDGPQLDQNKFLGYLFSSNLQLFNIFFKLLLKDRDTVKIFFCKKELIKFYFRLRKVKQDIDDESTGRSFGGVNKRTHQPIRGRKSPRVLPRYVENFHSILCFNF